MHEVATATFEETLYVQSDEPIYCSPAHVIKPGKEWLDSTNIRSSTISEDEGQNYQALRSYSMDYIALYALPKRKDKDEQGNGEGIQDNPAYGTPQRSRTMDTPPVIRITSPSH